MRKPFLLVALLLAGCASPAGMSPWPLPFASAPAGVPVAPAATPAAPTPVPAQGIRFRGTVELDGRPLPGAAIRLVDLASGQPVPAAGSLVSGADGAFDFHVAGLRPTQVLKVVAEQGGRTLTSLVDGRGRAVGVRPATYVLAQAATFALTVDFKLTAGTTAAAKAYEGAIKLQFQLDAADVEAGLEGAIAQAIAVAAEIERALAGDQGAALAAALDGNGEVADIPAFRAAIAAAGLTDRLMAGVGALVTAFVARTGGAPLPGDVADRRLDPLTSEDFPLARATITARGDFSFTGTDGQVTRGSVAGGVFVPTDEDEPTEPGEPGDPGGDAGPTTGDAHGGLVVDDGAVVDPSAAEGIER